MANELELKLAVTPPRLQELKALSLLKELALGPAESRILDNTYYDTPDGALRKARAGLRIRVQDGAYIQTLKTAGEAVGGLHSRLEWEVVLPAAELDLDRFPAEAQLPVLQEPGLRAALGPVFTTRFTRYSVDLRLAGGGVAELALDEGEILAGGRREPIGELELELKSGEPLELFALARELAGAVPMSVANLSKAQRGYALAGAADRAAGTPPRLRPDQSVSAAFAALSAYALESWQAHEWAYLHEPEAAGAVAGLAEAAARLRALLALFSGPVTRRTTQALRGELGLMEELLAWQRRAQIRRGLLLRLAGGGIWRNLPGRKRLRAVLEERLAEGEAAETALRARLDSTAHAQAQLDFGAWLHGRAWERDGNAKAQNHLKADLGHFAHDRLNRLWRALHEALHGERPLRRSDYPDQAAHLHKLLLASEAFASLYPRAALEAFLAPWRDLSAGLADLAELAELRELAGVVEGESGAELAVWLARQEQTLLAALEETRRAALKRKPYWLD